MSTNDLPFEQWHPDAQRRCGFWLDRTPTPCYRCQRCQAEYIHTQHVADYVKALHELIQEYRSIVRDESPRLHNASKRLLSHPIAKQLKLS